jgi:AcrR family transcriptional regulator
MKTRRDAVLRPRSVAAEKAIFKATLEILSKEGYAALTIDRVAAQAKASKATIYRRWKTKEHLVLAVFDQLPIAAPVDKGGFEADLVALFGQFARIMQDSPLKGVMPNLVAECVDNPALATALKQVNDQRRAPVRQIIQRALERGELSTDTDVELTIDIIQGAIAIRLYFLLDRLTDRWIRKLVQVVLQGIAKRRR